MKNTEDKSTRFIPIVPRMRLSSEQAIKSIRIAYKGNQQSVIITIGKQIASKIGLAPGDAIQFFYEDKDPYTWMIKKTIDSLGFKVVEIGNTILRCKIPLKTSKIQFDANDNLSRIVEHKLSQDHILIFSKPEHESKV